MMTQGTGEYAVGFTLSLINPALAQGKGRSPVNWCNPVGSADAADDSIGPSARKKRGASG
jgi:hypothetical protein